MNHFLGEPPPTSHSIAITKLTDLSTHTALVTGEKGACSIMWPHLYTFVIGARMQRSRERHNET